MAARRAAGEVIIKNFFSSPVSSRSLFPPAISRTVQPLSKVEMDNLGKLAGLQVSGKTPEFRQSVAQVLDFCASIKDAQKDVSGPAEFVPFEQDFPFEPPGEEHLLETVSEGNNAEVLLKLASKSQEGLFVAPATRPATA